MTLPQRTLAPETTTVRDVIDTMAERSADVPFLVSPETKEEITYRDLQACARRLSRCFLDLGLAKGAKVAFLLENGLFSPQLLLGAMYGGFVPVPVNTIAGASQVAYVLNHSDATVVCVSEEHQAMLPGVIRQVERPLQIIPAHPDRDPDWLYSDSVEVALPVVHGDDEGLLVYTSGSTGHSKGVLFTQRSILLNSLNTGSVYHLSPQDRSLCVLPLYHMNAIITTLFSTLLSGGSVVIPHQFSVAHFWEWVADYRCTWFALVPTIISHLVNWTDPYNEGKADRLRQIRFVRSSSAPLAPSLHRAFEEKFPLLLVEGMGMTEASTVFMNPPSRDQRRIGSPGLPCHETKIVDPHGHSVPSGQTGEILLRSPSLMKGYYKNPEATAEVLNSDGWLRTGDLGYQDADGYVFIAGRAKEIVIKGGENIAPREIDEALGQHAAVLEAAAVGVPDVYLGEDLVAYVVLNPGSQCSEQELLNHCAQILGEFKTPTHIYFVEDLPKGPSGKVQRLKLLERETTLSTTYDPTVARQAYPNYADQQQLGFFAPRTPIEEKLAVIWGNVLQRTPIGIYDNFFTLGGHSLLAAGILSRVRDAFQVGLPLRALFEAPTVAALAEHIEATRLTGERLRLPPVQAFSRDGETPLSFAQQRLWFLHQLDPKSVEYNIATARRFTGPLRIPAFEQSLIEIVRRHASLRTTFPMVDGQPAQSIIAALPFSLAMIDLATLPKEQRESAVQQYAREEAQRPFDLACGPLFRATLLHLADNEHVLLFTMHHIISDRWSMEVFFWELGTLYTAFSAYQPSPLPELSVQYADLAAWQRQWLQGEVLDRQLTYWRRQLTDAPPLLELPTDRPRPPVQTHRGTHQHALFPSSLAQALHELSRREGTTLFMTLLAAFQVLLFRYTGQNDVVVGSPTANRTRVETEQLIGFFINMLVLRTNLSGDPTFHELLQRVREVALSAYAHQELPFEKLVEELRPERVLNYSPLFQVVFHLRNVPERSVKLADVQMEILRYESGTAQFDVTFALRETPDGLEAEVEYNTDLFNAATITRMLGHYQILLEAIVTNPDERIGLLPLLTPPERQQLLIEWNSTQKEYAKDTCIHELFEEQIKKSPKTIAAVYEARQLTYRELNTRANQLAHYLRKLSVGPEVLVGLCIERSLEMIVAILGILKAGGAYVPLDPGYPQERLAFILDDTQAPMLLTRRELVKSVPNYQGKILCLDSEWEAISRESPENLSVQTTSDNLAYVIYTSGSTGKPKGVTITHRNVAAFLSWAHATFSQEEMSRVLASTSICFDLSVFELFATLTCGGTVVLVENALALAREVIPVDVTLMNTVPSAISELLRLQRIPPTVQTINLAGELLTTTLVDQLYASTSARRVYDLYGPSEATTYATYTLRTVGGPQTIGRPIRNTQIYVLDAHLHPVPIGVTGEIYIGGDGVTRGYLNRPGLTAEKFVTHGFDGEPDQRLYRTGDLARYLPDGNLEFLGRIDNQVKIRGFRIELGESETILAQHPGIREVVVIAREDSPGDKRLVAYVVANRQGSPTINELRSFLKGKLPEYMVPSTYVVLENLPLTPNGKIDRRALPLPELTRPELTQSFAAPRTPEEEIIAGIWAQVLGLQQVSVHDNFFELGGHSLKATQVVSRLRAALQIELPLCTLFEAPTVAGLAANIVQRQEQQPSQAELARFLAEVETLSEEEAQQVLSHIRLEST